MSLVWYWKNIFPAILFSWVLVFSSAVVNAHVFNFSVSTKLWSAIIRGPFKCSQICYCQPLGLGCPVSENPVHRPLTATWLHLARISLRSPSVWKGNKIIYIIADISIFLVCVCVRGGDSYAYVILISSVSPFTTIPSLGNSIWYDLS